MINLRRYFKDYGIEAKKLTYLNNYLVVDSKNDKYLLKPKDSNKREIFNYLRQVGYDYYLPIINDYNDYYEVYPYYDDNVSDKYLKAKELIYALAVLHIKTTSYTEMSLDEVKEIYEELNIKIDTSMKYFLDLQDYLEGILFLSPAQYLLINNISKFYVLLRVGKRRLDAWYNSFSGRVREVVLVGNVSLDNFRMGDRSYFVDFHNAKKGLVVYDLVDFYKQEATSVDFPSLFNLYSSKYQLNQNEFNLFCALISTLDKIKFSKDNYRDTLMVRRVIEYVDVTLNFVLEKDEENQEAHKEKFE